MQEEVLLLSSVVMPELVPVVKADAAVCWDLDCWCCY